MAAKNERRVAVITGSTRGIGKAIAEQFVKEGVAVVVNGRNATEVNACKHELLKLGAEVAGFVGDVSIKGEAVELVETAIHTFGGIDILVNNAGIIRDSTFLRMADEDWHQVLNVHLNGMYYCSKRAVGWMKDQNEGIIINLTSLAGLMGSFGQANYGTAKAGVLAFTWTLAQELARYSIRVNAISPAAVTDMTRPYIEKAKLVAAEKGEPLSDYWQIGQTKDVARVAATLCSDNAAHITGKVIGVNGNKLTMWNQPKAVNLTSLEDIKL